MTTRSRLFILFSGNGSNLQAIHDGCNRGELDAQVVSVIPTWLYQELKLQGFGTRISRIGRTFPSFYGSNRVVRAFRVQKGRFVKLP